CHAGSVVVPLRAEEDLGFVHQAAERLAVYNAVGVSLEAGADVVLPLRLRNRPPPGLIGKGGAGIQSSVFFLLYGLPDGHSDPPLMKVSDQNAAKRPARAGCFRI